MINKTNMGHAGGSSVELQQRVLQCQNFITWKHPHHKLETLQITTQRTVQSEQTLREHDHEKNPN